MELRKSVFSSGIFCYFSYQNSNFVFHFISLEESAQREIEHIITAYVSFGRVVFIDIHFSTIIVATSSYIIADF